MIITADVYSAGLAMTCRSMLKMRKWLWIYHLQWYQSHIDRFSVILSAQLFNLLIHYRCPYGNECIEIKRDTRWYSNSSCRADLLDIYNTSHTSIHNKKYFLVDSTSSFYLPKQFFSAWWVRSTGESPTNVMIIILICNDEMYVI